MLWYRRAEPGAVDGGGPGRRRRRDPRGYAGKRKPVAAPLETSDEGGARRALRRLKEHARGSDGGCRVVTRVGGAVALFRRESRDGVGRSLRVGGPGPGRGRIVAELRAGTRRRQPDEDPDAGEMPTGRFSGMSSGPLRGPAQFRRGAGRIQAGLLRLVEELRGAPGAMVAEASRSIHLPPRQAPEAPDGKPSQLSWTSLARVSGGDGGGGGRSSARRGARPQNVSCASSNSPRPTSPFAMRDSPQDGTSNTRSSKMACGGNTGVGFTHSALAEAAKRRTSVDDCMLPDHAQQPRGGPRSAAGAGRRRSPAREQRGPQKAGRASTESLIGCSL